MDKILPVFLLIFVGTVSGQQLRKDALPGETFFQLHEGVLHKYAPEGKTVVAGKEYISNGMTIFPDGSFTRMNEKKRKLREGQYLDVNGKVFNTLAALQAQQEAHRAAVNKDYYRLCNGEVMRHKGASSEKIKSEVILRRGITLYPDGLFSTPDGRKYRLREGQCMDITGKVFKNTQTFHLECERRIREGKN